MPKAPKVFQKTPYFENAIEQARQHEGGPRKFVFIIHLEVDEDQLDELANYGNPLDVGDFEIINAYIKPSA